MSEMIKKENIAVNVNVNDWQEAIEKSGQLLVDSGTISDGYIEQMIASVKTMGPYIVLAPNFALAHAAPSEAVKKTSISLITLKQPINFGSQNDPVSVVMCLACVDKTAHIEWLQRIAKKLMQSGMIDQLSQAQSVDQLHDLINS